jgi:phospholipid transport system transporter-binding protein
MLNTNVSLHKDETIKINGELYFDNLVAVYKKAVDIINTLQKITIDLSGLKSLDSSSLVFLTSVIRVTKQQGKKITFINMPKNLRDLARVSGVDVVFPLDNVWL